MAADRAIDRAMIEAGAAADAAEHVLEIAAKHLAPPVVEQDDVIRVAARRGRRRGRAPWQKVV